MIDIIYRFTVHCSLFRTHRDNQAGEARGAKSGAKKLKKMKLCSLATKNVDVETSEKVKKLFMTTLLGKMGASTPVPPPPGYT